MKIAPSDQEVIAPADIGVHEGATLRFVTLTGIDAWKRDGVTFEVDYDLARLSPGGDPVYRVRYTLRDAELNYILTDTESGTNPDKVQLLKGWSSIRAHHNVWGDGREIRFSADDRVSLFDSRTEDYT